MLIGMEMVESITAPTTAAPETIKMKERRKRKRLVRILAKVLGLLTRGNKKKKRLHRKQQATSRNQNLTMEFFNGRTADDDDDETLSSSTISPTYTNTIQAMCGDDFMEHLPPLDEEPEEDANFVIDDSEREDKEAERRTSVEDSEVSLSGHISTAPEAAGNQSRDSVLSNIYTLIDALVKDSESMGEPEHNSDDNFDDSRTRRSHVSSSIFSNATKSLCIFDDGSVTTAGHVPNNKPSFIAVHKRTTPAPVRLRRYTKRHGGRWGSPTSGTAKTRQRLFSWDEQPLMSQAPDSSGLDRCIEPAVANGVSSSEDGFSDSSGWDEFQRQASGNEDEMVDEGITAARLSEHILSPEPKKQVKVVL